MRTVPVARMKTRLPVIYTSDSRAILMCWDQTAGKKWYASMTPSGKHTGKYLAKMHTFTPDPPDPPKKEETGYKKLPWHHTTQFALAVFTFVGGDVSAKLSRKNIGLVAKVVKDILRAGDGYGAIRRLPRSPSSSRRPLQPLTHFLQNWPRRLPRRTLLDNGRPVDNTRRG